MEISSMRISTSVVFCCVAFFSFVILIQGNEKENGDLASLSQILKETSAYCERLDRISLHFVCFEEIKERVFYHGRFFKEKTYVYDYQLIRKDNDIKEQRILLEENGAKKHEENAVLKTKRFWHKYVIFGPIGLFGKSQQMIHNYAIKKEVMFKGERCHVIEVIPKSQVQPNHLFGKAWVRQNDCSILKIEWYQESMGNIERIEEQASKLEAKPRITFVSEYAFEKNGIRFPSRYFVKEEYVKRARRLKISETAIVYKDYKFFIVETKIKIK